MQASYTVDTQYDIIMWEKPKCNQFVLALRQCSLVPQTCVLYNFFLISCIYDKKCSKPKNLLAFFSKLFCFSFILYFTQLDTLLNVPGGCVTQLTP
jgi:hypothetical protein